MVSKRPMPVFQCAACGKSVLPYCLYMDSKLSLYLSRETMDHVLFKRLRAESDTVRFFRVFCMKPLMVQYNFRYR